MRRLLLVLLLLAAAAGGAVYYQRLTAPSSGGSASAAPARPGAAGETRSQPVTTRPVERRAMPVELTTFGTVQPLATVAVRARIDSRVDSVHFTEGQEVSAGDLLFSLDARPAEVQLRQAEANLARDRAQLVKAEADVVRYRTLVSSNAAARQQFEAAVASAEALRATVAYDAAVVDNARLTLDYTAIRAPINGRTGAIEVMPGNLVRAAEATPLVTLVQLRPINVAFSVAESQLAALRQAEAAGPLKVTAAVPGDGAPAEGRLGAPAEGRLDFIDNTVDPATGTIRLKAVFDNADTRLWPGQFVDLVLTRGIEPDALVVPEAAVQTGQSGPYVFVVRPDAIAEQRPVRVMRMQGGLAVIATGLGDGERVVVDGQFRLSPGTPVVDAALQQQRPAAPHPAS